MRILFFISLLFLSTTLPLHAQSCDDAYGMVTDENDHVHFVSYHTATHVQTRLHDLGVFKPLDNPIKRGYLNESTKTYYCLADVEIPYYETRLIAIDINTGHIKSTLPLGFVQILDYDTSTGKFYGIRFMGPGNNQYYRDFIVVDPDTHTITSLSSITPDMYYGYYSMVIDPMQQKFYLWTNKVNIVEKVLMTFDLESGALLSEVFVPYFFIAVQYNQKDGKCYGLSSDNDDFWFSSFDASASSFQHITKLPVNKMPWFDNILINRDQHVFLYYGTDAAISTSSFSHNHLYSLDLHTGEQVNSVKVSEGPSSYAIYHVPMGSVWHSSGCVDPIVYPVVDIPNLFTPNGDGSNESFEIKNLPKGKASLSVYNAWGGLVYSSPAYTNNWYAEHNEDGIYYYTLTTHYDQKSYQGWVQVLR